MDAYWEKVYEQIYNIVAVAEHVMMDRHCTEYVTELEIRLTLLNDIKAVIDQDLCDTKAKIDREIKMLTCEGYDDPNLRGIEILGLSTKSYNCLTRYSGSRYHFRTIADILEFPPYEWKRVRLLGEKTAREIEEKMHELGYLEFEIDLHLSAPYPF